MSWQENHMFDVVPKKHKSVANRLSAYNRRVRFIEVSNKFGIKDEQWTVLFVPASYVESAALNQV